jgi:chemotaxis-related protein WspB
MLFLVFELGNDRYAIDARQVVEILPLVHTKQLPQAPAGVAGLFNYRGSPVPAIDLSELAFGRPAARQLSTRLLLVRYPGDEGSQALIGLIVERVTRTARYEEHAFVPSGVRNTRAPYLGPVLVDSDGMLQRLEIGDLLPASTRDLLFAATEGTS